MRILFMGETGLCVANVSMGIYNDDDKSLWFSIDDSTLEKSEIVIGNVNPQIAENLLTELFTTGVLDISNMGLHVELC